MTKPLISAIIPTYKRPKEVANAVRSVFAQTWRPLECVVVDDGSGDETQSVLRSLESGDVQFRHVEVSNAGAGPARSKGMELATGEYFAFLDDDDTWRPQKIETQWKAMQKAPEAGVSFTRYIHAGAEDQPKPKLENMREGWVFETLCSGQTRAHQQTLMIKREVFERIGPFINSRNFQDFEYCLRASLDFQFKAVHEPLTVINTLESSISRQQGLEGDVRRDALKLQVLADFRAEHGAAPRYSEAAMKVATARVYDEHIKHLLWLGRIDDAKAAWDRAIGECGEQELLTKLKRKLKRAKVAGWFGLKLEKPE
jgi:glycosyltransferase involved in cell wall biosynthesis